jgi:serine/threonine protein kinase
MAPESFSEPLVTPAVDIWALGILTYRMVFGNFPFDGLRGLIQYIEGDELPPWTSLPADTSEECRTFISSLLEKDCHNRPTAVQAASHSWIHDLETAEVNNQFAAAIE